MTNPEPTIRVNVDVTNPGQFFACCGLLELADRLWAGATGWFESTGFRVAPVSPSDGVRTLAALLTEVGAASLEQIDPQDDYSSPIRLAGPWGLTLDWWKDGNAGGSKLKVWAGSMRSVRIAAAMQAALSDPDVQTETLLNHARVVRNPAGDKVEPFYFDSRRGGNAQSLDIGFAPDSFQMTTAAYPAVEFLCLVGLQRCRPMPTGKPRVFDYYTWTTPLRPSVLPPVVCGLLRTQGSHVYRFENAFRTDQRKHKGFLPATPLD